jgi:tRNA-modifying protein YgfZ
MAERELGEMLAAGEAFADLSFWRKVQVGGTDAFLWLNDLVSSDISDLGPGEAKRALLLSPTGRVRAEFTCSAQDDSILLLQDPSHPEAVDELLARYVLSSGVTLEDRTEELSLFAFPGVAVPPEAPGTRVSAPSCLGRGIDLLAPTREHDRLIEALRRTHRLAGNEDLEAWRIAAGIPQFGVDGTAEDLPQECGFEEAVAYGKGCYLGQEAMAKVRNLGHPRRVLLSLEADGPVAPGQEVTVQGREAGRVTSAARVNGRTVLLAQLAWDAREGPFETTPGGSLSFVSLPSVPRQAPAR